MGFINHFRRIAGDILSAVGFIGLFCVSDNTKIWLCSLAVSVSLLLIGQALLKKEGLV